MAQRKTRGLFKRGEVWHIDKKVRGYRIRESTGTGNLAEAERYLAHRMEEIREAAVYGVRARRLFREAATRYLNESTKASLQFDARYLRMLDPFIGDLPLESVHMGTLQPFIEARKKDGVKNRTVNYGLQVVRIILNLAASEWLDERGRSWLPSAPKIKLLPETDRRAPYPLSWDEQLRLFGQLPSYLAKMALFKVNTGCRDQEVCGLKWEWEIPVPELDTSVFLIPGSRVKNRQERLVVLNRVAERVIDEMRGIHPEYVFTHQGKRLDKMNGKAWQHGRIRAGLPHVRVHDLKHTFGRRLRAAGVSFEDRQDLLGHKSGRITTHYSMPELENLIAAANKVCEKSSHKTHTSLILKRRKPYDNAGLERKESGIG